MRECFTEHKQHIGIGELLLIIVHDNTLALVPAKRLPSPLGADTIYMLFAISIMAIECAIYYYGFRRAKKWQDRIPACDLAAGFHCFLLVIFFSFELRYDVLERNCFDALLDVSLIIIAVLWYVAAGFGYYRTYQQLKNSDEK